MKRILSLIVLSLFAATTFAQELDITKINGNKSLIINMTADIPGIENLEVAFKEKSVTPLVKAMKKWKKRMHRMIPSVKGQNSLIKPIPGIGEYDYLFFRNGNTRNVSTRGYLVPELYIDDNGFLFVRIRSNYRGEETIGADGNKKERCEFNFSCLIPAEEFGNYILRVENKLLDIRYDPSK